MLHNETNRIAIHKLDPVSLLVDCPSSTSLTWPAGVAPNSCPTVLGHVVVGCLQVGASIGVTRPQGQCGLEVVNGCLVLFPVGQGCAARHQGISIMGPQMQGLVIAVQGICIGAYKQAETGDALARQPDSWVYGRVQRGCTGTNWRLCKPRTAQAAWLLLWAHAGQRQPCMQLHQRMQRNPQAAWKPHLLHCGAITCARPPVSAAAGGTDR
jgi:hypothetical protein